MMRMPRNPLSKFLAIPSFRCGIGKMSISILLLVFDLFLGNFNGMGTEFLLAIHRIKHFVSQPEGQHFVLVLMEILCKFYNLLTFSTPIATFNLAEHRSINLQ